jgi:hypothetical protein
MQSLTIKEINEILASPEKFKEIESNASGDYYEEKDQGNVGKRVSIRDIKKEDLYLQITYENDSYGDNETMVSLKFVTKSTKTVEVYE